MMRYQPITQIRNSILIAHAIRSYIVGNTLAPGDKLPPVREIALKLGVSGPSVRKAITILSAAGIVTSCTRKGTLVNAMTDAHCDQLLCELTGIVQK